MGMGIRFITCSLMESLALLWEGISVSPLRPCCVTREAEWLSSLKTELKIRVCFESWSRLIAHGACRQFVGRIDQLTEILMSSCCMCFHYCLMEGLEDSCSSS